MFIKIPWELLVNSQTENKKDGRHKRINLCDAEMAKLWRCCKEARTVGDPLKLLDIVIMETYVYNQAIATATFIVYKKVKDESVLMTKRLLK